MPQHENIEEIKDVIIGITKLIKKKKIENPSDERLLIQAIKDYESRQEFSDGTFKWFKAVIERSGRKHS